MKKNQLIALFTAALLPLGVLAGCSSSTADGAGEKKEQTEAVSKEENAEGKTVKILTSNTGGKDEEEMKLFVEQLSTATGLTVTMEKPAEDYENILTQKLQSGETYDLIYMDHKQLLSLHEQEALTDITDKVKASDIMMNNIDATEWKDIEIDGKYYAGFNKKEIFVPVGVNASHLAKAGIDPEKIEPTLDGYYNMLKALKESNDTKGYYPLDIVLSETWDLQPWMASVGIKGGVHKDEADGKTFAAYAQDESAPVWEWLKKLYQEELLDPSCAVDKTKEMRGKMASSSQLISVKADWLAWNGLHNAEAEAAGLSHEDYSIISLPGVQTPDGDYMLRKGNASLWAIPVNAENPEGAFKVIEYFATQEGGELLSLGLEGHDYTIEDGEMKLTEAGLAHGQDHGAPFPIYKDFESKVGYNTGVEEGLEFGKYASIEMPLAKEPDYKEIVGKWGIKIVKDETSVLDGLKGMREELVEREVTQK